LQSDETWNDEATKKLNDTSSVNKPTEIYNIAQAAPGGKLNCC